ncbi:hypothetical protein BDV25DRAFT_99175 [Aspergillus avenaceus]|uniref:Uncharacterized protein n=1 Tax=Aspergillus avenaceus TaxID=36643 RepID=A0A5N6TD51_ASPAV|nr:hypothetical protein BDV25DRAFT_99175 [Aspergillus avenaceus]
MPEPPKRVVLEKSRTVRRRYQRSNKRLQFTASQIARIEREEERERRAQKLRNQEKRRIANKKKKAEKEAKAREERRRLGLPDPNVSTVPSSQPSLFNFLKKGPQASSNQESTCEDIETGTPGSITTEVDTSEDSGLENDEFSDADIVELENALNEGYDPTETDGIEGETRDDDEFSDCSIFYDESIIKEAEMGTKAPALGQVQLAVEMAPVSVPLAESFQDDTAILLEEFACEFDADEEFEQELARLDAG